MLSKYLQRLLLILLFFSATNIFAATNIKINEIEILKFPFYTRIIFKVQSTFENNYKIFTMSNPSRVVADFTKATLKTAINSIHIPDVNIRKIRTGHPANDVLRIVFDLANPVEVKETYVPNRLSQENLLIVDLYPPKKIGIKPENKEKTNIDKITLSEEDLTEQNLADLNSKHLSAKSSRNLSLKQKINNSLHAAHNTKKIVIVIDPGHGGKDTGTIGTNGMKEKDVVLSIGKNLAKLLNHEKNVRAALTRDGDYFVTLRQRLKLARNFKADLFIAVHADSYFDKTANGVSVYALSPHGASKEAARWLADQENNSELSGMSLSNLNDDSKMLRSVLIDMAQTETIKDSLLLGDSILKSLDKITSLHYVNVEQAPFMVLKSPDIPSILVETGFLSNSKEENRLRNSEYRAKIALALKQGIKNYMSTSTTLARK